MLFVKISFAFYEIKKAGPSKEIDVALIVIDTHTLL